MLYGVDPKFRLGLVLFFLFDLIRIYFGKKGFYGGGRQSKREKAKGIERALMTAKSGRLKKKINDWK